MNPHGLLPAGFVWLATLHRCRRRVIQASTDGAAYCSGGSYWFWRVSDRARFDITKLTGAHAVVSGVFLDP